MLRAGAIIAVALLALAGCQRPAPLSDVTGLLRAQGFGFLDIEPEVTVSPLCSMQVGATRYDFFWYEWQQQPENAPGAALHAAYRLIQIRDGRVYDGYYGVLPGERPACRPESREITFTTEADVVAAGLPSESKVPVGTDGLPLRIWVNGDIYTRAR